MVDNLNLFNLLVYEIHRLLSHFLHRFNLFLLVVEHLNGFCHSELDGICRISHIVDDHVHEYLVVLQ
jgi:hypothetical protein